jgi:hypothetical protein
MDLTQLKTQVMTLFMVKSNQNPSGGNHDIFVMLYTMLVMNLIEQLFKGIPILWANALRIGKDYFLQKTKHHMSLPMLVNDKKEEVFSITMKRTYGSRTEDTNPFVEKVDAVIEHLCNVNTSKHIMLDRRYILNTKEDIRVSPKITAKVHTVTNDEKGDLSLIELTLYSTQLNISSLREWVDELHQNYKYEKNNKLGNKKFFFNEIPIEPQRQMDVRSTEFGKNATESYNWATAPKHLTFSMNEFHTFKSFKNVFGDHVGELKERMDLFANHPEWYAERGIPHSLGILLHGVPGAGKTSTIKAIARDTGRHIFNLSLRPYTSQKQLLNLFYNENVCVHTETGQSQTFSIPLNKRVYVIEDIDCLTDVVYDREKSTTSFMGEGDRISLSFLLNLLDGVLETPGRLLVITSNYPEKLDRALVRPGRIDVKIQFDYAKRRLVQEMIQNFYTIAVDMSEIPESIEGKLTPAEVLECLCNHFKSYKDAIESMTQKVSTTTLLHTSTYVSSLSGNSDNAEESTESEESEESDEYEAPEAPESPTFRYDTHMDMNESMYEKPRKNSYPPSDMTVVEDQGLYLHTGGEGLDAQAANELSAKYATQYAKSAQAANELSAKYATQYAKSAQAANELSAKYATQYAKSAQAANELNAKYAPKHTTSEQQDPDAFAGFLNPFQSHFSEEFR